MKILLVDDEAHVLEAWKALLEAAGSCEVRIAAVGGEALKQARAWGGPDVLVTDVVMEPMDGLRLHGMLAKEFPAMRAVFVSGYDLSGYAGQLAGATVLSKPVTVEDLSAAVGLTAGPAAVPSGDPGVGATLGAYYLQEFAGQHGAVCDYLAWQQSMSRHVVLHLLVNHPDLPPGAVAEFLADARAKAAVTHPYLLAVHEAGEVNGHSFYTSDLVPGHTLAAYAEAAQTLDDRILLNALRTAAEVSGHFKEHGLARRAITPSDLLLDAAMRPRLTNIAQSAPQEINEADEVRTMAATMAALAAANGPAAGAAAALAAQAEQGWAAALPLVAAAKPAVAPKDAKQLTARTDKSKQLLEQSRQQQKKRLLVTAGLSFLLLVVGALALWQFLGGGTRTIASRLIEIPAGEFVYGEGEKVRLPAFWIDEYEVSIADYKEFLDHLAANPDEAAKFAHPDMPQGKDHTPLDWADNTQLEPPMPGYYTRAVRWKQYKDAALNVDSPVFNVDWYDAYAYAKWKGRRLPTEQEWEKAARGTDGRKYPWGDEEAPSRVSSGHDFDPNPKKGGDLDGYKRWSPVNLPPGDVGPYGVRGMAGNVSEWTATMAPHEEGMGGEVPVIRGGNWNNPEHHLTRRRAVLDPLQPQDTLGFRTVSDTPPQ
jgi:formylglycine-generating enzyme required for sulfatase activity/CheY-like chemotaxis protein